ncbi:hypothetical protein FACS189452_08840 [Bacteroidia bacterium]|nr:hypothetical protein FACS189452_08840 [Bacteroidia bacterium]
MYSITKGYAKALKIGVGVFHSFMVHLVQCGKMTLAELQSMVMGGDSSVGANAGGASPLNGLMPSRAGPNVDMLNFKKLVPMGAIAFATIYGCKNNDPAVQEKCPNPTPTEVNVFKNNDVVVTEVSLVERVKGCESPILVSQVTDTIATKVVADKYVKVLTSIHANKELSGRVTVKKGSSVSILKGVVNKTDSTNYETVAKTAGVAMNWYALGTQTGVNQDSIDCVGSGTSEWVNGQCKPITQSNALRTSLDSVTDIPQAGSTYNIDVASSLAWTAATTQSWVTVSPTMANGNSPITLTVQAYNAAAPTDYDTVRTATLRFTAGGAVVRTLKIEQRGEVCGVTQVTLSQTTLAIQKGYPDYSTNAALTATALPANAALKTLTWSSSNPATASIDQSGNITALAAGTATITARAANGKQASCALTVDQANVPWLQDSLDCKTPAPAGYDNIWDANTHTCTQVDVNQPDTLWTSSLSAKHNTIDLCGANGVGKLRQRAGVQNVIVMDAASNISAVISQDEWLRCVEASDSTYAGDIKVINTSGDRAVLGAWYITDTYEINERMVYKISGSKKKLNGYLLNYVKKEGVSSVNYVLNGKDDCNKVQVDGFDKYLFRLDINPSQTSVGYPYPLRSVNGDIIPVSIPNNGFLVVDNSSTWTTNQKVYDGLRGYSFEVINPLPGGAKGLSPLYWNTASYVHYTYPNVRYLGDGR